MSGGSSSRLGLESVDRDGGLSEGLDLLVVEGDKWLESLDLLRLGGSSSWNPLGGWNLSSLSDWLGWNSLRLRELEECLLGGGLGSRLERLLSNRLDSWSWLE